MTAGNAEQGAGESSVREDAAEGLLRLLYKAGCDAVGWGPSTGSTPHMKFDPDFLLEIEEAGKSAKARAEKAAEAWEKNMEVEETKTWKEEFQRGVRLSNIRGVDQATRQWLRDPKHWKASNYSLEMAIRQRLEPRGVQSPISTAGIEAPQPQPRARTSTRVTRRTGRPAFDNLFGLDDISKKTRESPKRSGRWKVTGPMMGCRRLALDKSDILQAKVEMGWEDSRRNVEPGVAVGAAAAASAQGYSPIDQRSPGMGWSRYAGGGGAGDGRDSRRSIGAGASGKKRQREEAGPDASPAGAYTAGGRGAASAEAGYGCESGSGSGTGYGYGYGYGTGYGSGAGAGAGAGAGYRSGSGSGAGAGAGVEGGEDSRHSKRARVSGCASASGSDGGITDCAGGSVSEATFSETEGAPASSAMGCAAMPTEQSCKGEDDEDDGSGGRGGHGGGGGSLDGRRATAKGSGD